MEHRQTIDALSSPSTQSKNLTSLKPMLRYLWPYKLAIAGGILALLVSSGSVLAMGKGLGFLVDKGLGEANPELLNQALLVMLCIVIVLAFGTYARFFLVTYVGERVVADIRKDVYRHILHLSPAFFETNKIGEILSRIVTDTNLLQIVVGSSLSVALRNALMLLGGIILLIASSPKLASLVAIIVPLVVFPILFFGRRVRALSRASQDKVAALSAHAEESLNGIRTIQAFTREALEQETFGHRVKDAFDTALRRVRLRAFLIALVILGIFSAIASVLWVGGHDVLKGDMSAGALSAFLFYSVVVASATGALSEVLSDLFRAAGAAERLLELLATETEVKDPSVPLTLPDKAKGALCFDKVTFHYPTRPDQAALAHLAFTVKPGERIAVVGPSGAGKTTVFNLLLRFYDPQQGGITIDGVDIRALKLQELRSLFGLVPQDPVIFSASAAENIRFARPEATMEEVKAAAEAAAADEFIHRLPEGYDTFLGEKGVRLSGGQRQRIAIARAILKDPAILLLDEATSALDSTNEQLVQQALKKLMKGRTTLVIAHRLSTVKQADRILVLDHGKLVQSGTHATLIKKAGLYQKLAKRQFGGEKK